MLIISSVNFVVTLGGGDERRLQHWDRAGRRLSRGTEPNEFRLQMRVAVCVAAALMIRSLFFFISMMHQSNSCRAARVQASPGSSMTEQFSR